MSARAVDIGVTLRDDLAAAAACGRASEAATVDAMLRRAAVLSSVVEVRPCPR